MDILLTPNQKGKPGYETYLNDRVTTVAQILRDSGYHTYMSGKWHLGHDQQNWPYNRGFEQSFALLHGGATMWNGSFDVPEAMKVTWASNNQLVPYPNGKYSSDLYADKIINMVAKNHVDNKPFFDYLSFQANHWPLGAPANYLSANKGRYDMGWDKLREQRLDNQKKLGVITDSAELSPRGAGVKPWNQLTAAEMSNDSKKMEVYAADAQAMDYNIGKVLNYLKKIGEYNNTLIMFTSDNGGEAQQVENLKGTPAIRSAFQKYISTLNTTEPNMGNWNSFVGYGPGWAQLSNTPFRGYKADLTEGGIRVPFIMKLPGSNPTHGIVNGFATGYDLVPTFLDYAKATYPDTYKGNKIEPLAGKSMLPFLEQKNLANLHPENETIPLAYLGVKAVYKGNWKAINLPKAFGGDNQWHLYDISIDPQESTDLSKEQPAVIKDMITAYDQYANQTHIIPPDYAFLGLSAPDEIDFEEN
jgi:arylsulfatase A-like enzyme